MKEKTKRTKTNKPICSRNNNKGITLIALILTIIILLILAVVAINAVKGDGIISHAKNAKTDYTRAQEEEQIQIALNEWKIEEIKNNKSFTEFMQEKFEKDNVEKVTENEIIVTMKSGNRYKVNVDGTITSIKGVSINKSSLTLELQEGTTVTETLTASLSEITGEITWSNSDNNKATISATKGTNITVTAVAVGTTTITATCGEYTATCTVKVTEPVNVSRGAFVEYNVAYKDAYEGYDYTVTNGWRLLDYTKNEDGTYSNVKLISTGIPAILYYYYSDTTNNSWYVTDSTKLTNFKNVLGSEYDLCTGTRTYYGLQASAGLYYNFGDIKFAYSASKRGNNLGYFTEIASNGKTYNSTNTTEITGRELFIPTGVNASVRLLTLPEMNTILGRTDIDSTDSMTDPTGAVGLFVLQNIKNITGMSSNTYGVAYDSGRYWLASPLPGDISDYMENVASINGNGGAKDIDFTDGMMFDGYYKGHGVRPVVTLSSKVQLADTNEDGVLEIQ